MFLKIKEVENNADKGIQIQQDFLKNSNKIKHGQQMKMNYFVLYI